MPISNKNIEYPTVVLDGWREVTTDPEYQWKMSHIGEGPKEPLVVIEGSKIRVVVEGHWSINKILECIEGLGLGTICGFSLDCSHRKECSADSDNMNRLDFENTSFELKQGVLDVDVDIHRNCVAPLPVGVRYTIVVPQGSKPIQECLSSQSNQATLCCDENISGEHHRDQLDGSIGYTGKCNNGSHKRSRPSFWSVLESWILRRWRYNAWDQWATGEKL